MNDLGFFTEYTPQESEPYICPSCGQEYSDGALKLEDSKEHYIIYRFSCPACGADGALFKKIIFDGYVITKRRKHDEQ